MESAVGRFLSNYEHQEELIVVFYATWFLPSLKVKMYWEAENTKKNQVVFVNVDEAIDLVEELKLSSVPAIYRFRNGEIVERKLVVDKRIH